MNSLFLSREVISSKRHFASSFNNAIESSINRFLLAIACPSLSQPVLKDGLIEIIWSTISLYRAYSSVVREIFAYYLPSVASAWCVVKTIFLIREYIYKTGEKWSNLDDGGMGTTLLSRWLIFVHFLFEECEVAATLFNSEIMWTQIVSIYKQIINIFCFSEQSILYVC